MTDEMLFEDDEEGAAAPAAAAAPWQVMIVDDEDAVHQVTRLVMADFTFEGRAVQFSGCHSAAEARAALALRPDIALILLDVVMETEHAGLELVRHIRAELGNSAVRIVLRTGQPGQAPQDAVIRDYDINDYRDKTELTHSKMTTVFCAALRAYRDLCRLQRADAGLRRAIGAFAAIEDDACLRGYSSAVLAQASALLGADGAALCLSRGAAQSGLTLLAATPGHAALAPGAPLPAEVAEAVAQALAQRSGHAAAPYHLSYCDDGAGGAGLLYLAIDAPLDAAAGALLATLCANAAGAHARLAGAA
ncbi:DUF3369 domain-containing protein, partial [Janthinobacterium sp.]|uniref:DUF3369 domain-containing protein n=1 Tax=Janthinobacterium sp. TaxID=1871054 RepID=UPI00293D4685